MPVAVTSDRRFRRAQARPSSKKPDWRRRFLLATRVLGVLAVVGYGGYRAAAVAVNAHVLRVEHILIRGNQQLSRVEVLAILGGLQGQSLMWTNLDGWRQRLLRSSWVRDAALRRSLPGTVDVVIAERQPMGIGRLNGALYLVDDRGAVIDEYGPNYAEFDLPIIDGLEARPVDGHPSADETHAAFATRVLHALRLRPDLARNVSQLDVSDLHNAVVILGADPALIRLGEDHFLQRLQSYTELTSALHQRVERIDYVDLRFDERIYVKPAATQPGDRPAAVTLPRREAR